MEISQGLWGAGSLSSFEPPGLGQIENPGQAPCFMDTWLRRAFSQSSNSISSVWNQSKTTETPQWENVSIDFDPFGPKFTLLHFGAFTDTTIIACFIPLPFHEIIQTSQSYPPVGPGVTHSLHATKPASRSSCSFTVYVSTTPAWPYVACCVFLAALKVHD